MKAEVNVKLTPYHAILIYKFMADFFEIHGYNQQLVSLKEAHTAFEDSLFSQLDTETLEDSLAESNVNILVGNSPPPKEDERKG